MDPGSGTITIGGTVIEDLTKKSFMDTYLTEWFAVVSKGDNRRVWDHGIQEWIGLYQQSRKVEYLCVPDLLVPRGSYYDAVPGDAAQG